MKCGGTVVCVVLLAVWISSAWWRVWREFPDNSWVAIGDGSVEVGRWTSAIIKRVERPGWHVRMGRGTFRWWFFWLDEKAITERSVPLWLPLVVVLAPTAAAWRRDVIALRRWRVGRCPKCGYDLRGLGPGSVVCPECGGAWRLPRRPCPACAFELAGLSPGALGLIWCPRCGEAFRETGEATHEPGH